MVAVIFSILAGILGVTQAGLNKIIGDSWGLSGSLFLNGVIYMLCNALLFFVVYYCPRYFSGEYLVQGNLAQFRAWWIVPGICGFLLVMGLVYSVLKIGPAQTFILCVSAQIVFSIFWDIVIDNRPVGMIRLAGAVLVLVGAVLASL